MSNVQIVSYLKTWHSVEITEIYFYTFWQKFREINFDTKGLKFNNFPTTKFLRQEITCLCLCGLQGVWTN